MAATQLLMQVQEKAETRDNGRRVTLGCVAPRVTDPPELADAIKSFFKWSPNGKLEFQTINDHAAEALPVGAFVRVTLEVVPTAAG